LRILFLSNYYPPYSRGGYEQWCQEVAEELVQQGHSVSVLTSRTSSERGEINQNGVNIHRILTLEVEQGLLSTTVRLLQTRKKVERENLDQTQELVTSFRPDVALIWGMWNISRSVPALLERMLGNRLAYYICDYWLTLPNAYIQRWREPANNPWLSLAKHLLGSLFLRRLEAEPIVELALAHPICVSHAVKNILLSSHASMKHARVIYGGTTMSEFSRGTAPYKNKNRFRLLYVGRLESHKGVHTAICAVPIVYRFLPDLEPNSITLDIIGNGDTVYIEKLKGIVEQNKLNENITFLNRIARSEIPEFMAQYDGLIFPSEWPEPFARTVLEAMAAGLVVIGTTTGGTGEILVNQETGLTFPVGNPEELAKQICRVFTAPELGVRLAKAGQERVRENFTLKSMVEQIQGVLGQISIS
jgi:glycogen synthase